MRCNRSRLSDSLFSRSAESAAQGAFEVLNIAQALPHPAEQLIALATAFKFMTEACGFEAAELYHVIDRMEADCRFRQVNTLNAVRAYCEHEINQKLP